MRSFAFFARCGWLVLLLLALPQVAQAASPPAPLTQWEYRYGEAPIAQNGVTGTENDPAVWQPVASPSNPPGRGGQRYLWLRATLPQGEWHDPVLYITSINLVGRVYLDGELIYQHGALDAEGRGRFAGWPWHVITLPTESAGTTLVFALYSDYTSIGLWGQVQVMERFDVFQQVLQGSAQALAVSALLLVLAILSTLFMLVGPQRRGFGALALFAYAAGLMLVAEAPARQLFFTNALVWDTLRAASYFTLPIALGLLLGHWLEGRTRHLMAWVWQLHLLYLAISMAAVALGLVALPLTFPLFDALLLVTLPLMLALAYWRFSTLALEQRLLIVSITLFAFLLVLDMLVAHGFIGWRLVPLSSGLLAFTLANAAIFLWHYRRTQRQLARANETLEQEVTRRTEELDRLVSRFRGLSYQDPLTTLYNRRHFDSLFERECQHAKALDRPLTLLMIDVDHFKSINDRFGHAIGDMVLTEIARHLEAQLSGIATVCRFGGEEFVAVMTDLPAREGQSYAQALVTSMAARTINRHGQPPIRVTLSCGVANYPEDAVAPSALLQLADQALYDAKHRGRNRFMRAGAYHNVDVSAQPHSGRPG
ncbi:GGDEF domain-containing protein [Halomonas sp. GD1P12]|uniref:GGDEF domain-containing protein n=1 Tax=Halomonas sp. GD1P12 TaxID=2982691 RepID=UPI0021E47B36|nr:GGDEF domain-containing protein [Halomonas sp. GD1P12]UYF98928.1 GGDEF domain-containing protein [Halomonas sp. GD1P12]